MTTTRTFVRIAAELSPGAVAALLESTPGLVSASIDRGPTNLCRPCVEITEEAASGVVWTEGGSMNLRARITCFIFGHAVPLRCDYSERCKECREPCPACGWVLKKADPSVSDVTVTREGEL